MRRSKNQRARKPWNFGRIVGSKPPLKPKQIWAIRTRLEIASRHRDLALFNLAIDSKLRGCDLVKIRIPDLILQGEVRSRSTVVQQKTGRVVTFEISEASKVALSNWLKIRHAKGSDCVWPGRGAFQHLTTRQYARLVRQWTSMAGLDPGQFGTHSLRRTKVALIYRKTGNLRACQILLGHKKIESTARYLGIEVDDALTLSEQVDI